MTARSIPVNDVVKFLWAKAGSFSLAAFALISQQRR